jgi:hypothetical protein
MTQMNYLGTHALQYASHDVDGGIVPVKKASSRDKTDFVVRAIIRKVLQ